MLSRATQPSAVVVCAQKTPFLTAQIASLWLSVFNNSLKFSRKQVAPAIAISGDIYTEGGRSFVRIVLADNGIGFDQQFAAAIFHPFTRLNRKDEFEGTGLGLALCKKIVERHRGSISVIGTPGVGARFTILLPKK